MKYIDCKKYSQAILDAVKAVPNKKELWILTMGDNPASKSYVKGKIRDCEYCGIPYRHFTASSEMELDLLIYTGNTNEDVGGIIIQLPLPSGVDEQYFVNKVTPSKDVDGFTAKSPFKPCTPEGIMYLLRKELGDLTGKRALVIGRGKLVGEPIAKMLLDADCTVTVAHSKTKNLNWELQAVDIIISAVGKPNTVNLNACAWNAEVVIDVGVNRDANGKLVGDCYNFDTEYSDDLKVTPVPGGIGLMTRAMLMAHVARLDLGGIV